MEAPLFAVAAPVAAADAIAIGSCSAGSIGVPSNPENPGRSPALLLPVEQVGPLSAAPDDHAVSVCEGMDTRGEQLLPR